MERDWRQFFASVDWSTSKLYMIFIYNKIHLKFESKPSTEYLYNNLVNKNMSLEIVGLNMFCHTTTSTSRIPNVISYYHYGFANINIIH